MTDSAESTHAGQRVYSPAVLAIYDLWVLGVSNHLIWRCPTAAIRALYDDNAGARHLDIGVGTGYYLDRARWPVASPDITLADLSPHSLAAASRRIARYRPRAIVADALKPLPAIGPFDSIALTYLLHCLPGSMDEKARVFDHCRPLLAPGGRLFGATILGADAPQGVLAGPLMKLYAAKGIFSNSGDSAEGLEGALELRFTSFSVRTRGTVALFVASP